MRSRCTLPALFALLVFSSTTAFSFAEEDAKASDKVDFAHEIVPILKAHCVECHGGKEAKGGFSINTRRSFLDDDRAVPGDVESSYFLDLVQSEDADSQMPPKAKPRVPAAQIAKLKAWVKADMPWEDGFTFGTPTYEPPLKPRRVELPPPVAGRDNPIDRIVDKYYADHKVDRPQPLGDEAFLRRVYLDLVGLLPPQEVRAQFLADKSTDKRAKLIDQLLDDDVAYAEHWLTFWNDLLRNDYAGTGFITGGRKQVSGWLYDALLENKPYDQFARELLAPPTDASRGFIEGIKWRGEVSAGQTVEIQFAQSISQTFLGLNMKCASCHDSFIDRWKLSESYGLAAIYATRELEIHRCDKPTGEIAKAAWLFPELGSIDAAAPQPERLKQLAALMTHKDNGRFSRTIVNRLWAQMMGRGIVHPLDAMQTQPWNEDLLDFLGMDLQDNNYDLKATLKLIANSQAYQSETIVLAAPNDGSDFVFRGPQAKRMTAEQFVDAVWQLTGAAPNKLDAPVKRPPLPSPDMDNSKAAKAPEWIWHVSSKDRTPAAGETILLWKTFALPTAPKQATAQLTVDNEYTLYINGKEVSKDTAWETLETVDVTSALQKGENQILLVARNAGSGPNAAAALFTMSIKPADGSTTHIVSDASWQSTLEFPTEKPIADLDLKSLKWSAAYVQTTNPWSGTIGPQLANGTSSSSQRPVRAALLASDFLMTTLGRPNRDQIVSSRPSELTTLEALDLSNNADLANWLTRGAKRLLAGNPEDTKALITEIYHQTLIRNPTPAELSTLVEALGDDPNEAAVADMLWVIVMSPEFIYVR